MHQDLKLAHGVLAEHRAHATGRIVVVVEAVDGDVVGARALARERKSRRFGRSLVQRAIGGDARREYGKRNVIAAIDRQSSAICRSEITVDTTVRWTSTSGRGATTSTVSASRRKMQRHAELR